MKTYLLITRNAIYTPLTENNIIPPFIMCESPLLVNDVARIHCGEDVSHKGTLHYYSVRRHWAEDPPKTGWDILIFPNSNSYTRRDWEHQSYWSNIPHPRLDILRHILQCIWTGRGKFYWPNNRYDITTTKAKKTLGWTRCLWDHCVSWTVR